MKMLEKMRNIKTKAVATVLSETVEDKDCIPTNLPILNVAFSGELDGGFVPGITMLAGESRSFKSLLALYCLKSYFNKYPESIAIVYDTEFGITEDYWASMGIDTARILKVDVENVETLKFDIMKRLKEISKGDKIFFMIDSLGAVASSKEIEDALNEKSVADMQRAKSIRSLLRMITPHFSMKDIPCVIINHVYKTLELYSKTVVSGGTANMYASNQVFIISKSQEKDGDDLVGWNFTIHVEKSRFVRERSKLTFTVLNDGGILPWSGLFDLAFESGLIFSPSKGWYSIIDLETGEIGDKKFRAKELDNQEFWNQFLTNEKFKEFVRNKFSLASGKLSS